MKLRLYNTLSGKLEDFDPIDPNHVRMYVCGPTVYDRAHIGNARPAVVFDVLYRLLRHMYPKVTYVRNITDIDDKIYKAAQEKGVSIQELTLNTTRMYHDDMSALNVLDVDVEPKATEHVPDIIKFIENLIRNGKAYVSDGHVYFSVESYAEYGKLSKKNTDDLLSGARIEVSESKRNPLDFVLWKPIDERFNFGWDSPWGKGRPGWHIECSVMSSKYLGRTFDIHGGGIDLVFPHHENEIAQSCVIDPEKPMAMYWIHNGHLNVNGVKMSKSLGNFFTVNELLQKYDGEVIRLSFLMTHYSAPQNFSHEALDMAKNILDRWYNAIRFQVSDNDIVQSEEIHEEVLDALKDNLNTPKAISILSNIVDEINKAREKSGIALKFVSTCRKLLGIMQKTPEQWFCEIQDLEFTKWIENKIKERCIAKQNKNYAEADKIRTELLNKGIAIEDTKDGKTIWKNL